MEERERATIPLHGEVGGEWGHALVSPEDVALLSAFRWWVQVNKAGPYAYAWGKDENGKMLTPRVKLYMHRVVARTPSTQHTDHRNGDTLDNRRENLRNVHPTFNSQRDQSIHANDDEDYREWLERREACA